MEQNSFSLEVRGGTSVNRFGQHARTAQQTVSGQFVFREERTVHCMPQVSADLHHKGYGMKIEYWF